MKATLASYHQSPRKVRLVANLVRGQSVATALAQLKFLGKRAAGPLATAIKSAAAAASAAVDGDLYVKNIRVDKGLVMRRFRPGARGRAFPLRRRLSRVVVELGPRPTK
ncbi:MAG: 50S ribosomal protein L22 [Patescibacteria group bacterium]